MSSSSNMQQKTSKQEKKSPLITQTWTMIALTKTLRSACVEAISALELSADSNIYPKIASSFALGEAPVVFAKLADNPMALHKAVFVSEDA